MDDSYVLISIAIMAVVTIAIRFTPFVFLNNRKTPKVIEYLGTVLPSAIMAMLVIYCLKETSFTSLEGYLPALISSAVVVLSYVYKRNTLLSIVLGTLLYMLLIQLVF